MSNSKSPKNFGKKIACTFGAFALALVGVLALNTLGAPLAFAVNTLTASSSTSLRVSFDLPGQCTAGGVQVNYKVNDGEVRTTQTIDNGLNGQVVITDGAVSTTGTIPSECTLVLYDIPVVEPSISTPLIPLSFEITGLNPATEYTVQAVSVNLFTKDADGTYKALSAYQNYTAGVDTNEYTASTLAAPSNDNNGNSSNEAPAVSSEAAAGALQVGLATALKPAGNEVDRVELIEGAHVALPNEHFAQAVNATWGVYVADRNTVAFPAAYEGHKLHVIVYSSPKHVGTGVVTNGTIKADFSGLTGTHTVLALDETGAVVAKANVTFGDAGVAAAASEAKIARTSGFALGLVALLTVAAGAGLVVAKRVRA